VQWWAIASALWLCVGFGLCWGYRRAVRLGNADARFWAYVASGGGAIAGVLWGSLGLVVMLPELQQFETYVVTGLCLLSVGAALGYAVYLPAMVCFSIGIIVPLSASFIAGGDSMHVVMAILSLQCCAALIAFGVEFNRALRNEFELTSRVSALARDLEAEKQQVLAASAAKSRFLAAASHDLRQPVHSISLYVGALGRFVSDGEGARIVHRLQGSVRALDGLFEGLQDISRIDAGVVPVQQRALALSMLYDAIDMQFRASAELKGLELVFEPTDAVVESDRMLLERILSNLVSNAIRYTFVGARPQQGAGSGPRDRAASRRNPAPPAGARVGAGSRFRFHAAPACRESRCGVRRPGRRARRDDGGDGHAARQFRARDRRRERRAGRDGHRPGAGGGPCSEGCLRRRCR
jgi:signal transduction histidine kinase